MVEQIIKDVLKSNTDEVCSNTCIIIGNMNGNKSNDIDRQ